MSGEILDANAPQVQAALQDLRERIKSRFPSAQFAVIEGLGDDPCGIYLMTTVDIDDPDEVLDVVMERLLHYEIDQGLPVYVLPLRTPERIAKDMADRDRSPRVRVTGGW